MLTLMGVHCLPDLDGQAVGELPGSEHWLTPNLEFCA